MTSRRAMSSPSPRPLGPSDSPAVFRVKQPDITSRSEPSLPLSFVQRRQSKGGLRELFSKNRSTRTLAPTLENEETLPRTNDGEARSQNVDPSWLPPPFYQALPQSVKHVILEAPTISAESIIRMSDQRSAALARHQDQNVSAVPATSAMAARRPNWGTTSITNAEWTRKCYILTTSGHLLQYSGEGAFDRKPEKVLQLGKESAAFASDAIEGRHFLLHVSQSCSDNGEPDLDSSKHLFSRIGIKTASARRMTKVLFLVFDSAVEFDSWLSAIRKMIGSLGGRSYGLETLAHELDPASVPTTNPQPMIPNDPEPLLQELSSTDLVEAAAEGRPSTQSSIYTATDLERLRDSKTSNVSAGTEIGASPSDSPPSSPSLEKCIVSNPPQLELPDLGPSTLVDFSQHGKGNLRFSVLFSDLTRRKSIEVKPTTRFSRQISFRSRRSQRDTSIPETERTEEVVLLAREQRQTQERRGGLPDKRESQGGQRPLSTISPLPASFPLRHTVPDLSSAYSLRSSRQFPGTSEVLTKLPKRYSSLEYSPSQFQSDPSHSAANNPRATPQELRRPTSMQLRKDRLSSAQMPARLSSLRTFGVEGASSAAASEYNAVEMRPSSRQSQGIGKPAFGPPVAPPPSCPLPAVPADPIPSRRQSLATRELGLMNRWGGAPPEFF